MNSAIGHLSKYSHLSVLLEQTLLSKLYSLLVNCVALGDSELWLRYVKRARISIVVIIYIYVMYVWMNVMYI